MKRKIGIGLKLRILYLLVILYSLILPAYAFEFDNVKSEIPITKGSSLIIGEKELEYRDLWEKYKPIELKNSFLGIPTTTILKGAITSHTYECSNDCESIITIELKSRGQLIQDIRFKRLVSKDWQDYYFTDYKFYISNKEEEYEEDIFETECTTETNLNGSENNICNWAKKGTTTRKRPIWQEYDINEELEAGTYLIKISGNKDYKHILDWQIKTNGIWIDEWAIWGTTNLTSGLWTYLTLNSTTPIDSTGNITWANSYGAVSSGGIIDNSLSFDGINDRLTTSYVFNISSNPYSLSVWINTNNSTSTYRTIFGSNWGSETGAHMRIYQSYIQWIEVITGTYYLNATNLTKNITDGNWHHLVFTKNATSQRALIYIDGVLSANTSYTITNLGNNIYDIGSLRSSAGAYQYGWNGLMDEFGIWNRTLTDTEIFLLYNYGLGITYPFNTTLININLASPINNYNSTINSNTFVCNITNPFGLYLTSANLWTNSSGAWKVLQSRGNPTAYYKLNLQNFTIDNQTKVTSSSGKWNGTYYGRNFSNGVATNGAKIEDGALKFDGTNDYVNVSNDVDIDNSTTILLWYNSPKIVNESIPSGFLLFKYGSYALFFRNGQSATFRSYLYGTGTTERGSVLIDKDANEWHHLAVVFDATTKKRSHYQDGVLLDNWTETYGTITNTNYPLYIGRRDSGDFFNGSIDQILIYNRSLSESEILEQYNSGRSKYVLNNYGLKAQYSGRDYNGSSESPNIIFDTNHITEGKVNQGFGFDGIDDRISLSPFNLTGKTEMSVAGWINPTRTKNENALIMSRYQILLRYSRVGDTITFAVGNSSCSLSDACGYVNYKNLGSGWNHLTGTYDNNTIKLYINGELVNQTTYRGALREGGSALTIGASGYSTDRSFNGSIDDVRIYDIALTPEQVLEIYNEGLGTENLTNLSDNNFSVDLPENSTLWTCSACDIDGECGFANENRTIDVDTIAPNIIIINGTGLFNDGILNTNNTITLNIFDAHPISCVVRQEISEDSFETGFDGWINTSYSTRSTNWSSLESYSVLISDIIGGDIAMKKHNVYLGTNLSVDYKVNSSRFGIFLYICNNGTEIVDESCSIGYTFNGSGTTATAVINTTEYIGYPKTLIFRRAICYGLPGSCDDIYYDYTYIDNIKGILDTIFTICNNNYNLTIRKINNSFIIVANDSFGNIGTKYGIYNYKILQNSQNFTQMALEQSNQQFILNTTINPLYFANSYAMLVYDGVSYSTTKLVSGSNTLFIKNLTLPLVNSSTNKTFYWIIKSTSGEEYTTQQTNQTIVDLEIDNCLTYSKLLYNFSIKDEGTQLGYPLYNGTLKINLFISPLGSYNPFVAYNKNFNSTEPKTICINSNLTDQYRMDVIAEYTIQDHVVEFYYLDNFTLSDSVIPINKDLYSLLTTDSTTFLFTYKDNMQNPVKDAIIGVYRYYIDKGNYLEVETAKTDDNGQSHVHLVEEDVIYYFNITKNGKVLYVSSLYNAKCLSTPCSISLSSASSYSGGVDIGIGDYFNITSNKELRTVTLNFNLENISNVTFGLYQFKNNTVKLITNQTITTSNGEITLNIPFSYDNSTYFVSVFKNQEFIKSQFVDFSESGKDYFGAFGLILGVLFILSIILIAITEGAASVIFIIFGFILVGLLKLVEMNWAVISSLIIIGGVIIFKLISRGRIQN